MKRFLIVLSLIATAFVLGSCLEEGGVYPAGEEVPVVVTAELPSVVTTKAFSKAENVDVVYYEIWNEDWSRRLFPVAGEGKVSAQVEGNRASIKLTLVKGFTYNMIFWAQDSSFDGYGVGDLRKVTVDYSKFKGNQDSYDAFYTVKKLTVKGTIDETVTLRRPFAQLNFGASVMETSFGPIELGKTEVKVSQLATVFDTRLGMGEGQIKDVTFAAEGTATDQEMLETDGRTFHWMSMNYMLMMDDKDGVVVTGTFGVKGMDAPVTHVIHNVPLEKNHRTNIIGDLFTSNASLKVVVDPVFEKSDVTVDIQ